MKLQGTLTIRCRNEKRSSKFKETLQSDIKMKNKHLNYNENRSLKLKGKFEIKRNTKVRN